MVADLPELPAGDGPVAGALVSEGLCPWCGGDLEPRGDLRGGSWTSYGWCEVCELGWSLHPGETEPHTWFADQVL